MIDVLAVDRWSGRTHGWLHRASAPAKIVAAGACIGVLIASRDVATLALVVAPALRSRTNTSSRPFPSYVTRSLAEEAKTTWRPSALIRACRVL